MEVSADWNPDFLLWEKPPMDNLSDADQAVIEPFDILDDVFDDPSPQDRLENARTQGRKLRERMLEFDPVPFYRSFELVRVPYPTRFAFLNVKGLLSPFIHIVNRLFVVQFRSDDGIKTLLVSPSDPDRNRETPFFKNLSESFGPFQKLGDRIMAPQEISVVEALRSTGLKPEDVDYVTYDHLHTQDIRGWFGTDEEPGLFPNAKLLVMDQEWVSTNNLLPPQEPWYCPEGIDDVDSERIIRLDGDVFLGEGVALVRTPGHTEGNHSVAVRTPEGVMVTSENGVGPDAYEPTASELDPVREYAEQSGMEVILNGNTLERGIDQYVSMVMEKSIAGPSQRDERFPNMVCSSEMDSYWAFPGIEPTFKFGSLYFGRPQYAM